MSHSRVLLAGHLLGLRGITQHAGADEDHQVALVLGIAVVTEEAADAGNVAQQRHFLFGIGILVADQATQDDDAAVLGQHGGLDLTLVGDHVAGFDPFVDGGDFLDDFQPNAAVGTDGGADVQLDADILALNGLEGIGVIDGGGAGDEGDFLADQDRGFLVVQGRQRRCRQQVGLGIAAQGIEQHRKTDAARGELPHAGGDAVEVTEQGTQAEASWLAAAAAIWLMPGDEADAKLTPPAGTVPSPLISPNSHCTPSSLARLSVISAMIASTATWARRVSRRETSSR